MSKNGSNADVLAFSFSGLPRRWSREWLEVNAEMSGIAALSVMKPASDLSEEEQAKVQLEMHMTIAKSPELMARRDALIAQILVNVPRSWVHEDAPDDLDWHDPESLDWVLEEKFPEILVAIGQSRAKN